MIKSSWSSNDIRLATYSHACCVYYGLFNFWINPSIKTFYDEETIQQNKSSLYNRFKRNRSVIITPNVSLNLKKEILNDLQIMNEKVIEMYE